MLLGSMKERLHFCGRLQTYRQTDSSYRASRSPTQLPTSFSMGLSATHEHVQRELTKLTYEARTKGVLTYKTLSLTTQHSQMRVTSSPYTKSDSDQVLSISACN
jgi:hypothetical protein